MKIVLHKIIKNSWFQSVLFGGLITIVFVWIWNAPITQYNIEIEPFESLFGNNNVYSNAGDFNNDGFSERIRCSNGAGSESMDITYYDKDGFLSDQYHIFNSNWSYELKPAVFDIDNDNKSELLFFTIRNDSVFFNAFSLTKFYLVVDHLYISSIERHRDVYAFRSEFFKFGDFDIDGRNELFCWLDAGFGLKPRGVFKIEFPSLEVKQSNTEYMGLQTMYMKDLDDDGLPEILCRSYVPSNTTSYKKYSDTISYICVLDYDLNFLFEPIPLPGEYTSIECIPCSVNDNLIYAFFSSRSKSNAPYKILVVNNKGEIINSKHWRNVENPDNISSSVKYINGTSYLFFKGVGQFKLTPELDDLPDKLLPDQTKFTSIPLNFDLDNDGSDEWITFPNREELKIYNEKTGDEVSFSTPFPINSELKIYPFYQNYQIIKYMISTGGGFFYVHYTRNPYFFLLYIVYFIVFILTTAIIYLILYYQKKNIEKKWNTEKQLTELQFNSVKNQLNPHFLFNALNSVAYMINAGKKEEAYDFLSINSRMIQRVMDDSNEIKRPLKDEIQFTKDFLDIQTHRFKDKFKVEIAVDPKMDLKFAVPKMCIHTYAENAVKHGFRNTRQDGLLKIEVNPFKSGVKIKISDNGMGRKEASKYKDSSGNGIKIMNDFYALFEKYYEYKISCKISDNKISNLYQGTIVELIITQKT